MKPERFKRTKSVVASSAIALVVAALVMGVSSLVFGPRSASSGHLGFELTNGSASFTIMSTVYTTPSGTYPAATCSGTPALLYPAVTRCVVFSIHNNLKAQITVTGITTALDTTNYSAPPADCSGTNLVLPTYSSATGFNVASGTSVSSPGVPIELKENGAPQNDCKNLTYHFNYTGTAKYTEVYGTSTGVTSSQNPSTAGQSVIYTATVTASATASEDPVPSSPTGSVTFKDGSTTVCNAVALTSTGTTTATAPCTVSYATTAGSPHHITAVYTNTDGNFSGSTSPGINQIVVSSACITTAKSGNLTITSGQAICIASGGTQSGNVTVNNGGELDILGGSVGGGVTVNSGGALYINTGKVSGNVSATGASYLTVCGGTFSGNISASSSPSTTFVLIGDNGDDGSPACAGNSVAGNISVTSNAGGSEIGGNAVNGGIALTGTTGTESGADQPNPEIENNKVAGGLACSGNNPVPINDSQPNTVKGSRTGQCSAAGF